MRVLSVGMSMEHGSRAKVTHRARDMLHAPHESIMVGVHRQVHTNRNPQRSELRGIHIQITVPLGAWRSPRVAHPLWTFYCLICPVNSAAVHLRVCTGGHVPPCCYVISQFHTAHVRTRRSPIAPNNANAYSLLHDSQDPTPKHSRFSLVSLTTYFSYISH